jgi:hypothetical protein
LQPLWVFLRENQAVLASFQSVLRALFDFCDAHGLKRTLLDAQSALGLYEDAIQTALGFLATDATWAEKFRHVEALLQSAHDERARRGADPDAPARLADDALARFVDAGMLQLRFVSLAIETGTEFAPGLDLLLCPAVADELAAIAFLNRKFPLGFDLAAACPGGLHAVCEVLLEKLSGQSLADFLRFTQKVDPRRKAALCKALMKAVCVRARSGSDVPRFVAAVIEGAELQIQVLTECGFLQEALALAQRSRTLSEVANIMQTAQVLGNQTIAKQCAMILRL